MKCFIANSFIYFFYHYYLIQPSLCFSGYKYTSVGKNYTPHLLAIDNAETYIVSCAALWVFFFCFFVFFYWNPKDKHKSWNWLHQTYFHTSFREFHTILERVAVFPHCRGSADISEQRTHFLASAFPNLATRSEVAYLLCVLLLPFLSWQGLSEQLSRDICLPQPSVPRSF